MRESAFLNKLFVVRITMDLNFTTIFFVTQGLGPVKPGPRAAKPITPPYVENNYRIEVKITFMLIGGFKKTTTATATGPAKRQ